MMNIKKIYGLASIAVAITSSFAQAETLDIDRAFDSGVSHPNFPASNAIDGNTNFSSRWAAEADGDAVNLVLELDTTKEVTEVGVAWGRGDSRVNTFEIYARPGTSGSWTRIYRGDSSGDTQDIQVYDVTDIDAQQIRVKGLRNSRGSDYTDITEVEIYNNSTNDFGLDGGLAPSENFNLTQWNIGVPIDEDNNGRSDTIRVSDINNGYEHSDFFYTASDGGMVFKSFVDGPKTSENTSYTRSELREMLRGENTSISTQGVNGNNWVFSSTSEETQEAAGAVDGNMTATLAVNHVTTTGSSGQIGRVIIGQIHAPSNEPIRLYYRKLPNNELGGIYFAHEEFDDDETYVNMIGSRSSSASNPSDGIALDEVFSYEIDVVGDTLTVSIMREDKPTITKTLDMSNSGYDHSGAWMYFKAGVYNQNNTGDDFDYVQATFYALEQTH